VPESVTVAACWGLPTQRYGTALAYIYGRPETAPCWQPQTTPDAASTSAAKMGKMKAVACVACWAALSLINVVMAVDYVVGNPAGGWDGRTDYQSWAAAETFAPGDTLSKCHHQVSARILLPSARMHRLCRLSMSLCVALHLGEFSSR
jgi:hypothetical protein